MSLPNYQNPKCAECHDMQFALTACAQSACDCNEEGRDCPACSACATPYPFHPVTDDPQLAAATVLSEAAEVVEDRMQSYGPPNANHARTAALWGAYLGVPISSRQVCMLNVLQTAACDAFSPKRGNLVDIAGYVRNAEIVSD